MNNNGIVLDKLKRKLCYRGHVFFEAVGPDVIVSVLDYLKEYNPLYNDITIDSNYSHVNLSHEDVENNENDYQSDFSQLEETEDPLDEH